VRQTEVIPPDDQDRRENTRCQYEAGVFGCFLYESLPTLNWLRDALANGAEIESFRV